MMFKPIPTDSLLSGLCRETDSVSGARLIPAHCSRTNAVNPAFSQIPAYAGFRTCPLYIYCVKIGSYCAMLCSDTITKKSIDVNIPQYLPPYFTILVISLVIYTGVEIQ